MELEDRVEGGRWRWLAVFERMVRVLFWGLGKVGDGCHLQLRLYVAQRRLRPDRVASAYCEWLRTAGAPPGSRHTPRRPSLGTARRQGARSGEGAARDCRASAAVRPEGFVRHSTLSLASVFPETCTK